MKNLKIIWVDDMTDWVESAINNLQLIAQIKNIKLNIMHVKNGEAEDLMLKLRNYNCDCIVMDYMMAPFNGDHYVNLIREGDDYEHLTTVPILFYSQETDINLEDLITNKTNLITVYRGNLENKIIEMFFGD